MKTLIHNLVHEFQKSKDPEKYFNSLNKFHKSLLLYSIDDKFKIKLISKISENELVEIFKFMDPDKITDIIQILSKHKQKKILSKLDLNYKQKIRFLLKFTSDSAAGLMSLNYIIISINDSKKEILDRIKKHIKNGKKEPTILVINENRQFLGELRISNLLFDNKKNLFENLKKLPTITYDEDQEEVIDIFRKNKHNKVVVMDNNCTILGIIHAKDILKVIDQEDTQDYYGLAGLDQQEDIIDNAFEKVKFRLGWLILNLATAFLAAWVVSLYQDTISKYVLLAAFMPIIAGMGGNAGTQTIAILIRSLALKKMDKSIIRKIILNEIFAGILNGIVIGILIAIIAYLFNNDPIFGLIAAIAVILNLIIAAIFGTLIPLILNLLNYDPAASSTVFVTTATDVFGFFIFLGLAKIFLI